MPPTSAATARVGRRGRAGDVRAGGAGGVAALPLVGVGDRRRAGPGARRRRSASSPSRAVPETTGTTVFTGGAAATTPVTAETADELPPAFVPVTTTRSVPPTSAATARVGRDGRAGDVRAAGARGVAALPLVGVGDRRRAGPRARRRRQRLARHAPCPRRREHRVDRRRRSDDRADGGDGERVAAAFVPVTFERSVPPTSADDERVGRGRRARDVRAGGARGVAALPLVGVGDRRRAGPRARRRAQREPVAWRCRRPPGRRCSPAGSR